jgi:hypothetical protein
MVMLHTLLVRYNAWKLFRETRQEVFHAATSTGLQWKLQRLK